MIRGCNNNKALEIHQLIQNLTLYYATTIRLMLHKIRGNMWCWCEHASSRGGPTKKTRKAAAQRRRKGDKADANRANSIAA